ncbi:MAG: GGDEF domain-containing protein [Pseudomonadota bacterium]
MSPQDQTIYVRLLRPMILFVGMVCYALFTWWLVRNDFMQGTREVFLQFAAVWVLGLAFLIAWSDWLLKATDDALVLFRALWCNVGAVGMALLVPDGTRLLMLVIPLFGILYAALHLNYVQVILTVLITLLAYLFFKLGLIVYHPNLDLEFELFSGLAFVGMLGGLSLLSWEVMRLRERLQQRNARLRDTMDRLTELASRDELTQVYNRRFILDVLARQKALADRGQQPFSVCYCDLDHFKQVNDRFGHAAGDEVLRSFSDLAGGVVRNVDYVARFGGEEFLLVLVGAEAADGQQVAQRLAARTRQIWHRFGDDSFTMTVSVGFTVYRPGERIDDLLNRADRALYNAKREGRDRVVVGD